MIILSEWIFVLWNMKNSENEMANSGAKIAPMKYKKFSYCCMETK